MSWSEFLTRLLESTNKVEKAAIFNRDGQPLATTEDLEISECDGRALLSCLSDPARSLTRISLDGTDFRCFQGNDTALLGRATNDVRRVLVARLTDDALVLVLGNSTGHGSFLYEVQHHLQQRQRRQMGGIDNLAAGDDAGVAGEQKRLSPLGPSGLGPSVSERGDRDPQVLP